MPGKRPQQPSKRNPPPRTHPSVGRLDLHNQDATMLNGKDLDARRRGRFYTHEVIGCHLIDAVLTAKRIQAKSTIKVIDPFAGDGRLVVWLLSTAARHGPGQTSEWLVTIWDCDREALRTAARQIGSVATKLRLNVKVTTASGDTFEMAQAHLGEFDICITNPPWEVLKPDRRELAHLGEKAQGHVEELRSLAARLQQLYPTSAEHKRFAGWGTNLARCGTEVALRLTAPRGVCGIVSPASLLADQLSGRFRHWIFTQHQVLDLGYFVAEARLFNKVDQQSITLVARAGANTALPPHVTSYDRERKASPVSIGREVWRSIQNDGFVFPIQFGLNLLKLGRRWVHLPRFADLEGKDSFSLWAGRELDETGHLRFLGPKGRYLFLKGRMIQRYVVTEKPATFVREDGPKVPVSAGHSRLVWRDVSRPNQKRRMHATIVPSGWVTGNSLSVAYFRDDDLERLRALLGVMNSFVFEAQARARLATAHVSLSAVREVRIPDLRASSVTHRLSTLVERCLAGDSAAAMQVEIVVARLYGLTRHDFGELLEAFEKVSHAERDELTSAAAWSAATGDAPVPRNGSSTATAMTPRIPNHYSPTLSELDQRIVGAVPPGGNWKDIPESIPSDRLKQIRKSFEAGEGSRSTYYGRLRPDAPSYTINTYFPRPGNGCHIHYDFAGGQHRTISHREAARLQSFPDSFVFKGSRASVAQQIGNAVPPLLAYQIAKAIPFKGQFIDLFSGAGGLALGFKWAGWEPVVANDIDRQFLQTYQANVHEAVIPGDITDSDIFASIVVVAKKARKRHPKSPLFVLGGPPCQGFSTAGNRRSMNDGRNWLFRQYKAMIEAIHPDGFIFENVTGLLNMDGGKVFEMIRGQLGQVTDRLSFWRLQAEQYGVPQRRTRVLLVGDSTGRISSNPPQAVTELNGDITLFGRLPRAISTKEALGDLPSLQPGEDGSHKQYAHEPSHPYQELMRGSIDANTFLRVIAEFSEEEGETTALPEFAHSVHRSSGC